MRIQIDVSLKASRLADRAPIGIPYASVVILDSDSSDRAIATFMDSNSLVAQAIEDGLAYVYTQYVGESPKHAIPSITLPKRGLPLDPAFAELSEEQHAEHDRVWLLQHPFWKL